VATQFRPGHRPGIKDNKVQFRPERAGQYNDKGLWVEECIAALSGRILFRIILAPGDTRS